MAHAHTTSAIAIAIPTRVSMPMILRRWSRTAMATAITVITAVNLSHSFGSSLSFSFMESVGHRFERARHLPLRLHRAVEQEVAQHQIIHLRVHEAAVSIV